MRNLDVQVEDVSGGCTGKIDVLAKGRDVGKVGVRTKSVKYGW